MNGLFVPKIYSSFLFVLLLAGQAFALTISGNIYFEKVVHTKVGSGSSVSSVIENVPVSKARIYNGGTEVGFSNENGTYSVDVSGTVFLEVRCDDGTTLVGTSLAGSGMSGIYDVTIYSGTPSADVEKDLLITVGNGSGAFNLLDQFQFGLAWFSDLGYNLPSSQSVRVVWPDTGSYFEPDNYSLGFLGTGSDTDEFDDSVIQHELGHLAMEAFSEDDSLGGSHLFTSKEDLRLSWSEGVANYLSCAIRGSSQYLDTTNYNSSSESSSAGISASFADTPSVKGCENEFSVAHVLWNARSVTDDEAVVDTLASFNSLSEQISMDSFHDQWSSLQPSTSLTTIYANAGMEYLVDSSGGSFTFPGTLTTADTLSDLTFFGKDNEDVFSFIPSNSGVYTFSTSGTTNGALTSLSLYASNESLLATNNQVNGQFSNTTSSLTQSSMVSGQTYYVKVSRFNSGSRNYGIGWNDGYSKTVGSYGGYSLSAELSSVVEPEVISAAIANSSPRMGDSLTLSIVGSTSPSPDSYTYLWMADGAVISGQTNSTLSLLSSLGLSKGVGVSCNVTPVYSGVSYPGNGKMTSSVTVLNTAPEVDAGEDVSFSDSAGLTRGVTVTDVDDGESFSYTWTQNFGPTVSTNISDNTLFFQPNGSGTYSFSVSVSDGTDSNTDNVSFVFDELYVEPTTRSDATSEELSWLENPSVSNVTEAGNLLDQVYVVAQTTLTDNVVSGVIEAIDTVLSSNVSLSSTQVSQVFASVDNVVDESTSLFLALSEVQQKSVSNSLKTVLEGSQGNISLKDGLKALEVFNETLQPYASGSGIKANISDETEEALGSDLLNIVDVTVAQLSSGDSLDYEKGQVTVLGEVFSAAGSSKEIMDASGQLSMTLPSNFTTGDVALSVTKMAINPHAAKSTDSPSSEVVSFKIRHHSTMTDVDFSGKSVTLKIPVSDSLGSNQSYVPKFFDTETNTWSESGITYDSSSTVSGEVSFTTDHLTDFAIFIENDTVTTSSAGGGGGGGCMLGVSR